MSLTPDEVEHKEFTVTLRGFDQSEVVSFLQTVAADYRNALELVESGSVAPRSMGNSRPLGRLVPGIDASSDDFQAVGDQVAEVLRSAAEAAATIRAQAREEAENMIEEAGARVEDLHRDVKAERDQLEADLVERHRQAEEQAKAMIDAADAEARAIIQRVQDQFQELAQGERDIAARLRSAVIAVDAVLAEVGADRETEQSLVSP